jgi:trimethylamine corrinoid protein
VKSRETSQEILNELQEAVAEFDRKRVQRAARLALTGGVDTLDAIVNGLGAGVGHAIELCASGEYFLPEMAMCGDAFHEGLDILRPHLRRKASGQGTVVIGTVEGDEHDIGKNLVGMLLEAAGFAVCDLGVNVSPARFVQETIRTNADLVCISTTLTTSLFVLPRLIDILRSKRPRVRILVGGGAVSAQQALQWGVDGYAPDAWSIWRTAMHLVDAPAALWELAPVS